MTFIIYPEKIVKWRIVNQINGVISCRQSNTVTWQKVDTFFF